MHVLAFMRRCHSDFGCNCLGSDQVLVTVAQKKVSPIDRPLQLQCCFHVSSIPSKVFLSFFFDCHLGRSGTFMWSWLCLYHNVSWMQNYSLCTVWYNGSYYLCFPSHPLFASCNNNPVVYIPCMSKMSIPIEFKFIFSNCSKGSKLPSVLMIDTSLISSIMQSFLSTWYSLWSICGLLHLTLCLAPNSK